MKTNITIIENGKVVTENKEVAEIMNNYFIEAVQNLEIEKFTYEGQQDIKSENVDEVIEKIIEKYKSHPSILKIKGNVKVENKFNFNDTTEDEIYSKIKLLDPKKACMEKDIPAKMLIGTNDIISGFLSKMYNDSKNSDKYPTSLKTADVTPIHKEREKIQRKTIDRSVYYQFFLNYTKAI